VFDPTSSTPSRILWRYPAGGQESLAMPPGLGSVRARCGLL